MGISVMKKNVCRDRGDAARRFQGEAATRRPATKKEGA
jgi:hypothetical protein